MINPMGLCLWLDLCLDRYQAALVMQGMGLRMSCVRTLLRSSGWEISSPQ